MSIPLRPDALAAAVREIERHVAASGWDQPPRLFALAETARLLAEEPQLAEQLGGANAGTITSIEQEDLPQTPLPDLLAGLGWSEEVSGCALVLELVAVPGTDDDEVPDQEQAAWASAHPERQDMRLAVAVLRNGSRASVLRVRADGDTGASDLAADPQGDTIEDTDLATDLASALLATLEPGEDLGLTTE
jgi:hypothetical protein